MAIYDYEGNIIVSDAALPSTVIVAANNSSVADKAIANYVCDGINDEVELQQAIDTFATTGGQIILCNGDYYIDSFTDKGSI